MRQIFLLIALCCVPVICRADWPQAAGSNFQYVVDGTAPTEFSAADNKNIIWRTPLPNTGESTPIVSNGRIFLTCHTPMQADAESGQAIFGLCFDAATGKELWRRELPATRSTDMASGFSDNTAASAVSDGRFVCFVNVGGSVRTFDFDGKLIWEMDWVPFGRHHARQQEPILHDGKVIFLKTIATDLEPHMTTKAGAKPPGRDKKFWTQLHAVNLATGKPVWVAECGTSVHSASLLGRMTDGTAAILTGRGGGHAPPEEPYGISLINADTGKTIRDIPIKGYAAHQNCSFADNVASVFVGQTHRQLDLTTGSTRKTISLNTNIRHQEFRNGRYQTQEQTTFPVKGKKNKKPATYHTDIRIGDYHYFRTHSGFFMGRVNVSSGAVEYLQLPILVQRDEQNKRTLLWDWDNSHKNDVKNNDGFVVCQDKRAQLHGWGHVSAASPIVVGDFLYAPTMVGTVYVLRWNAKSFGKDALISVSDLGPAGTTWSLSSLAHSGNRLYARTLKELICIGE